MDLIHNMAIRIIGGEYKGLYRVLLDEPIINKTVLIQLDAHPVAGGDSKGGRKRLATTKHPRKKPRLPNVGELIWMDRDALQQLGQEHLLHSVELERENKAKHAEGDRATAIFAKRMLAMEQFLSLVSFREQLLCDRGLVGLVVAAQTRSGLCKSVIYKLFSQLCRYGFSEASLQLDFHRCGAPTVPRPCDPAGRKKAGAKTMKQRLGLKQGVIIPPEQPGTSSAWTTLILAADKAIPAPKPAMPARVTRIIHSAFVTRDRFEADGKLIEVDPALGSYPNRRQIRRVLEREIPRLQRLLDQTTKGHFNRALRGLVARNWKGVAGPGHTWAIDSTVGDIYLRSSINRAWVIGRPVVYIIVDVWSTAVVGFHVCLMGPSWDMAKLALFSAGAAPTLMGTLWGYEPALSLNPAPTLCGTLLCDRGEYLSRGAKQTGMVLLPCESYTAPYRPDEKGIVEVLHRITKDQQFLFVPGAIDARRAELELRRFNPDKAMLSLPEFVRYLYVLFTAYNLSADREHRLDAHMRAAGVYPSPAGLWHWGHDMGIGYRRAVPFSDLSSLLMKGTGRVRRDGVFFGGMQYDSQIIQNEAWTTSARNFGGQNIECRFFPGSVRKIWTPHVGGSGLIELDISDQSTASPELTWDEVADARAYYLIGRADREHLRSMTALAALKQTEEIIRCAKERTQEAIDRDAGPTPNFTDARFIEVISGGGIAAGVTEKTITPAEEVETAYLDTMRALLQSSGTSGEVDD